jgi:hypothetical protein
LIKEHVATNPAPIIDYKNLRRLDPEAARQAVLDYLASADGNVAATARAFAVQRSVVYDILRRQHAGSLADRSYVPNRQPTKTPPRVESRVIAAKNRTGLGNRRLSRYLAGRGLEISPSTIRNILARNRHRIHPPSWLRRAGHSHTRLEREQSTQRKLEDAAHRDRLRSLREMARRAR